MKDITFVIKFFEFTAAILAIIYYKKYAASKEKYFLHFLWFMVFTETIGHVYRYILIKPNIWVYIIYVFISFLFYFYWYYTILKKRFYKKFIVIGSLIFILVAVTNMFTQSWLNYHISTFYIGAFITTLAAILYFSELLNDNKIVSIKHSLRFWITTGLLLFNLGMIPFMAFSNDYKLYPELRKGILVGLNLILYTCYSLGFIWAKAAHKQSL